MKTFDEIGDVQRSYLHNRFLQMGIDRSSAQLFTATMEGGYLPWKNKTRNIVDHVDAVGKPLPPPPPGSVWFRESAGSWVLKNAETPAPLGNENIVTIEEPTIIEHTVMPDDTLQGICLRYRASVMEIRRMNLFSGNNIHCKKTLRIPLSKGQIVTGQENTKDVILQKFRNETSESLAESRVYLEDNNWELELALKAWREDEQWEHKQYFDVVLQTQAQFSSSTHLDDSSREGKRTVFAATVDETNVLKKTVPVAIRMPKEVAPHNGDGAVLTIHYFQ